MTRECVRKKSRCSVDKIKGINTDITISLINLEQYVTLLYIHPVYKNKMCLKNLIE